MTKRTLLVLLLGVAAAVGPSSRALAAAPERTGWWTAASVSSPVDIGVPIGTDVPPGGLLVQSAADPDDPVAFGALTFELPEGAVVTTLVLHTVTIDGEGGVALCALDRPDFPPATGGALDAAPGYDCAHRLTAAAAPDGSYTFHPEPLRTGPLLAVAVVPTSAFTRVVTAPLGSEALSTRSTSIPTPTTAATSIPVVAPGVEPVASAPSQAIAPVTRAELPATQVPAPITAAPQVLADAPVVAPAVTVASRGSAGGRDHRALLALLLAAIAVAAWWRASASASQLEPVQDVS
jgi:hypothetical protein